MVQGSGHLHVYCAAAAAVARVAAAGIASRLQGISAVLLACSALLASTVLCVHVLLELHSVQCVSCFIGASQAHCRLPSRGAYTQLFSNSLSSTCLLLQVTLSCHLMFLCQVRFSLILLLGH
ncbi:hypothetical protein COO60DRAFT_1498508, partial [Scenedesmus sp. NREL 46B-D3]